MQKRGLLVVLAAALLLATPAQAVYVTPSGDTQDPPLPTTTTTEDAAETYTVHVYWTRGLADAARERAGNPETAAKKVANTLNGGEPMLNATAAGRIDIREGGTPRAMWQSALEAGHPEGSGADVVLVLTGGMSGEYDGWGGDGVAVAAADRLTTHSTRPIEYIGSATELVASMHEVGHALGLTHGDWSVTDRGACTVMAASIDGPDCEWGYALSYSDFARDKLRD